MRKALALLFVLVGVTTAFAAQPADKSATEAATNNVEMLPVIAPIVIDGKLTGYFYISCKLVASSQSSAKAIRDKVPFIQDAFVRDVNIRPIAVMDAEKVDRVALGNHMMEDARALVGAGTVTGIVFGDGAKDIGIKFASLRPDETPSAVAFEDVPVAEAKPAKPEKAEKAH